MDAALQFDIGMHTVDEILALPDGKRAEIIDGFWFDMATPSTTHQMLTGAIYSGLRDYIKTNNGKCRAMIAPYAVFISNKKYDYVEPDVMVICDENDFVMRQAGFDESIDSLLFPGFSMKMGDELM